MQVEPVTAKRGRPPLPIEDRLDVAFSVRLKRSDADSLYRYAIKQGEPVDRVLRDVLLRFLRTV